LTEKEKQFDETFPFFSYSVFLIIYFRVLIKGHNSHFLTSLDLST